MNIDIQESNMGPGGVPGEVDRIATVELQRRPSLTLAVVPKPDATTTKETPLHLSLTSAAYVTATTIQQGTINWTNILTFIFFNLEA